MHPTLLEWLASFEKTCEENSAKLLRCARPTEVYNSLVMLGIEKPEAPIAVGESFSGHYVSGPLAGKQIGPRVCDCLSTIAEEETNIAKSLKDIAYISEGIGIRDNADRVYISGKHEYIAKCRETIALYTSMHETHASFNRQVHESMKTRGLLMKVREVCLRDNRKHLSGKGRTVTGDEQYGKVLATFLVDKPEGWV
jgi:hypothetical protein